MKDISVPYDLKNRKVMFTLNLFSLNGSGYIKFYLCFINVKFKISTHIMQTF